MPFPPGYHPTPRGAPLHKAVADARWVVTNAEDTLHAVTRASSMGWSVAFRTRC